MKVFFHTPLASSKVIPSLQMPKPCHLRMGLFGLLYNFALGNIVFTPHLIVMDMCRKIELSYHDVKSQYTGYILPREDMGAQRKKDRLFSTRNILAEK